MVDATFPLTPNGIGIMRTHIAATWLIVVAILLSLAATAGAQQHEAGPPFSDLDIHYDLQLFAPPIVDEYGDEPVAPNYGWFCEYNRVYVDLNRPDNVPTYFDGDKTWGNRFDVGYMTEENHGWDVTIWKINKTNVIDLTAVTDVQGNMFTLQNNVNTGGYNGVEVNKTFRTHVGEHGGFFEPFIGFRYGQFNERLRIETLVQNDPVTPTLETGTGTAATFDNNMVGGQIGARWFAQHGHWVVSSDVRGFALNNFQGLRGSQTQIVTVSDGAGGFITLNPITTQIGQSFSEFVPGGEVRLEAAYIVTRKVRLRVGFELMHFGRGIGRGFNQNTLSAANLNDQSVTYAGVAFGFEVNR